MIQMKKWIAAVSVAALLVSGCAAGKNDNKNLQAPTNNPAPTQTKPADTDQLTEEKKQEIEQIWVATLGQTNWYSEESGQPVDGLRYYGSYDGFDVLFSATDSATATSQQIGNAEFAHNGSFVLYAYADGQLRPLDEVFDEGLITEEALSLIATLHEQYQRKLYPLFAHPSVNGEIIQQMKLAFLKQFITEPGWTTGDLTVVYYGEYDGAHVGFINGILNYTQAFWTDTVGGISFHYRTGQMLLVFFEGELMDLQEAYERDIMTKESLIALHKAYSGQQDHEKE